MKKDSGPFLDRTRILIKVKDGIRISEIGRLMSLLKNFFGRYEFKLQRLNMGELRMHVKVMNYTGKKSEYEIKTDIFCDKGVFSSKKTGWNLYDSAKRTLVAISEQVF